jgi:hypothetical protein
MLTTAVPASGIERQGIAPNNVCISVPPFTVAVWVNPKDAVTATTLWSAAGTGFTGWYFNMSGGNYGWQALSGSSGIATPSRSVLQNKWQHLTAVELSANSRACYLDAANKGTDTTSVSVTLPSNAVESIGKYDAPGGGTGNNLNGTIADVRVYNRALTDAEVWELYDPRSRWDLYWQPNTRAYSFMSAAAAFDATQFPHIPMDQPYIVPVKMVPSGRVS